MDIDRYGGLGYCGAEDEMDRGGMLIVEDPQGDLSLSLLKLTLSSSSLLARPLPTNPETEARDKTLVKDIAGSAETLLTPVSPLPHSTVAPPLDAQLLLLAASLSNPLRAMVKADLVSAWDVADILDVADSLLHRDSASRSLNHDILSIGTGFVRRLEQIAVEGHLADDEDKIKTRNNYVQASSQSPIERALQDLKDYFRILNRLFDQANDDLALEFIAFFKKGWWARSKTLDQILEDCQRTLVVKKTSQCGSPVKASSPLVSFFRRRGSQPTSPSTPALAASASPCPSK